MLGMDGMDGNPILGMGREIVGNVGTIGPMGRVGTDGIDGIEGNPILGVGREIDGIEGTIGPIGKVGGEGIDGIDGNSILGIGREIDGNVGKLHFVMILPCNLHSIRLLEVLTLTAKAGQMVQKQLHGCVYQNMSS